MMRNRTATEFVMRCPGQTIIATIICPPHAENAAEIKFVTIFKN